jgi:predicted DNA-binding transcriptional regulator YafY
MNGTGVLFVVSFHIGITIRVSTHPLGLVFDGLRWMLVCEASGAVRRYPVGAITHVESTSEQFERDPTFDLEEYWRSVRAESARHVTAFRFRAIVSPGLAGPALKAFDGHVYDEHGIALVPRWPELGSRVVYPPREGWVQVEIRAGSLEDARTGVLSLGGGIRVISPIALVESVADYAARTVALYEGEV